VGEEIGPGRVRQGLFGGTKSGRGKFQGRNRRKTTKMLHSSAPKKGRTVNQFRLEETERNKETRKEEYIGVPSGEIYTPQSSSNLDGRGNRGRGEAGHSRWFKKEEKV